MNVLCRRIWNENGKTLPTKKLIERLWHDYAEQEISKTSTDLSILSNSQLKILVAIANGINYELTTKKTLSQLDLSSGGVIKALNILLEKDFIEYHDNKYEIIDPLIKYTLQQFYGDYF